MSKAGKFEIRVWQGGHPIWCTLHCDGSEIAQFNSLELADLQFAVERARIEAKVVARQMDPDRTEDY